MPARITTRTLASAGLATGLAIGGSFVVASAASAAPAEHVSFCHALGTPDTAGNGYVVIPPSETGTIRGHANWDFKNHVVGTNGHAADIIPPFVYTDRSGDHAFPGQNWDAEGQAIYDNDCVVPEPTEPEPTEPEPTEPEPTEPEPTEPEPTEPTTTEPTTTEPTTTEPTEPEPTETTSTDVVVPPVETPAGPQTPGVVQTDGAGSAGDNTVLVALGVAGLLGLGGAGVTVGLRNAARRH